MKNDGERGKSGVPARYRAAVAKGVELEHVKHRFISPVHMGPRVILVYAIRYHVPPRKLCLQPRSQPYVKTNHSATVWVRISALTRTSHQVAQKCATTASPTSVNGQSGAPAPPLVAAAVHVAARVNAFKLMKINRAHVKATPRRATTVLTSIYATTSGQNGLIATLIAGITPLRRGNACVASPRTANGSTRSHRNAPALACLMTGQNGATVPQLVATRLLLVLVTALSKVLVERNLLKPWIARFCLALSI